jgi:hypothetical protein
MNEIATNSPQSELVEAIERARALLDAGDVELALKVSSVAYDQAKAAAGSAERVRASRDLIDKARRLQADALKIETMCYVAMANAVDEAQTGGVVARIGRPVKGKDNILKMDEVGIDKRRLHEARKIRSTLKTQPDFIDRIIADRLARGLEPTRSALRSQADRSDSRGARNPYLGPALVSGARLGNLKWYEIDALIRDYRRDLALLERIKSHCIPADPNLTIFEVMGRERLASMMEGAND